jgi:beta-xylosidase
MLQKLMADGVTPDGDPVQILDRDPNGADGPYVEAPNLRLVDGTYYLTFSSGCYCDDTYDISWATSNSVSGGYAKAQQPQQPAPLAVTVDGMEAPGKFFLIRVCKS